MERTLLLEQLVKKSRAPLVGGGSHRLWRAASEDNHRNIGDNKMKRVMTLTGVTAAALLWGAGQSYAQYVPPPRGSQRG